MLKCRESQFTSGGLRNHHRLWKRREKRRGRGSEEGRGWEERGRGTQREEREGREEREV